MAEPGAPRRCGTPGARDVKAVLFDLYGTLVDIALDETSPAFWAQLAREMGDVRADLLGQQLRLRYIELCRTEAARRGAGGILDAVFPQLLQSVGQPVSPGDVEQFAERFRACSTRMFRVKSYATPLVAAIRESGCRIGLVSNTEALLTRLDLHRSGLAHHFDAVVLSSEVGFTKPDPRIFTLALQRLQVKAEATVFVGNDVRADITGAHRVGLRSLFINPEGPGFAAGDLASCPDIRGAFPVLASILSALELLGWNGSDCRG